MILALLIATSCLLLFLVELTKRKFALQTSLTRRAAHIGTAIVAGVAPLFVSQQEIILVSFVFAVGLFFSRQLRLLTAIHTVARHTLGEIYLPLGVALAALVFLPHDIHAFQFGVFVMGISDALAGFVGERFGKHIVSVVSIRKSIEGSVTFFLSTLLITLLFAPAIGYQIIVIPLFLMFLEFILIYGLDNLFLPVIAGLLLQLL